MSLHSFKNSILIIVFNYSNCIKNKELLHKLYEKHFKTIIFYSDYPIIKDSDKDINYVNIHKGEYVQAIFMHFYKKYKNLLNNSDGLFILNKTMKHDTYNIHNKITTNNISNLNKISSNKNNYFHQVDPTLIKYNSNNKNKKFFDFCYIGPIYEDTSDICSFIKKYFTNNSVLINTATNDNWISMGSFDYSNKTLPLLDLIDINDIQNIYKKCTVPNDIIKFIIICHSNKTICTDYASWLYSIFNESIPIIFDRKITFINKYDRNIAYKYIKIENTLLYLCKNNPAIHSHNKFPLKSYAKKKLNNNRLHDASFFYYVSSYNSRLSNKLHTTISEQNKTAWPKIIYMCNKTLQGIEYFTNNWKKLNPEYTIVAYNDTLIRNFLKLEYSKLHVDIFDFLKDGPIKADFWRICILYKYGGIYADMDLIPMVPIHSFIENDVNFVTCSSFWCDFNMQYNPNFIACEKHNIFLKRCIDWYVKKFRSKDTYDYWDWSIMRSFTDCINIHNYNSEGIFNVCNKKIQLIKECRGNTHDNDYNIYNNIVTFYSRDRNWNSDTHATSLKNTNHNKIFAIGFNKTATTSLYKLFLDLNYNAKHITYHTQSAIHIIHQYDAFSNGEHYNFEKYYEEYPNSLFILNTRPIFNWLCSRYKHAEYENFSNSWCWPISREKTNTWFSSREKHFKNVLNFFKYIPNKLFIVNIEKLGWENAVKKFINKSNINSNKIYHYNKRESKTFDKEKLALIEKEINDFLKSKNYSGKETLLNDINIEKYSYNYFL
tara:strand:+ start:136 stop:2451 length:2316 start_codon:yes stop_codon:yes gene_type:complete